MQNFDEDQSTSWFGRSIAARGFVRGATILIGVGLFYGGIAALWKHQSVGMAMQFFESLFALMVMLGVSHAVTPPEASEIRALTSARGLLRWLSLAACLGCVLCSQFAGFWLHDFRSAIWCGLAAVLDSIVFAGLYLAYCQNVDNDRVASKRSVSRNGTARDTMIKTAGLTATSFMVVGFSTNNAGHMLASIGLATATICAFAIYNWLFTASLDIDHDRG